MPAPPPAFYAENVLEDAIATLTPGGALASKPVERLDDRDIGLECEDSGTSGTRTWHWDRGAAATTPTVHALILHGSRIAGETFTLETSPDDAAWTDRGDYTPAADGGSRFALDAPFAVPRYVRLTVTDPAMPVIFTEVFLSPQVAFTWKPSAGTLREPQALNVAVVESQAGRTFPVKLGERRWSQAFTITSSPDTDRTKLYGLLDTLADTAKAFWFYSVTGELRWVRLLGPIAPQAVSRSPVGEWDLPVSLVEELP